MAEIKVSALVEGGKATAGPPIAPALGTTGVNIYQVVQKINEETKEYKGLKVPVLITVDRETKEFTIDVGMPPTSALIIKQSEVEKGSSAPGIDLVGNISLEKIVEIAKNKEDQLLGRNLKNRVKSVVGTCKSCGITVEDKNPMDVLKEIDEGIHDNLIK
ncbi:MAG: 50S ribosomal protein L11 [Candidatus Lokiarchaeota archaeon]|nr:50S ribosomal protein L11 [Candidatus Lokiarchaeota archaeon]